MIAAQGVSVAIGPHKILHDVSIEARPGQVTSIIGPNGSGKTTLLKALCNDLAYTGTISLNGTNLQTLAPVKAAALRAVLPQATILSFPFTVREVVALGLTAGRPGVSMQALDRLPEEALAQVDLHGFAGRYYGELSGGEQQRVQLARVLCQVWEPVLDGAPRYLFLDEPVSSLDIAHQLMIMDIARRFADAGGGVIAILHDLNLTAMYSDAIVAISKGRVVASGTPNEVLTDRLIATAFDCTMRVGIVPPAHIPFVLPQSASAG